MTEKKAVNTQNNILLQDEQAKQNWFDRYNEGVHRQGRIWLIVCLLALIAVPFLLGLILQTWPDMNGFLKGFFKVAIVYFPSSLVEYLIYVPMLGSGASYLSFITGNLSNLKIPCVMNAREMAGARTGTPENEIVSTLSVAVSSLVTVVVIAAGVMLLMPLQGVFSSPALQPAFENVVPALFGALGLKYFIKGKKFAAIPLVLSALLCVLVPSLIGQTSVLLIAIGALTIGIAFIFFKKGALD